MESLIHFWSTLCRDDVYKPLILMVFVFLLQQWCGMSAISYYAVNILTSAGSSVNEVSSVNIEIFRASTKREFILHSNILLFDYR